MEDIPNREVARMWVDESARRGHLVAANKVIRRRGKRKRLGGAYERRGRSIVKVCTVCEIMAPRSGREGVTQ